MKLEVVRLVLQLGVGGVFLVSSLGKARHPVAFLRGVAEYRILPAPLGYAFGAALIPAEGFVALSMLSGWATAIALPLATGLLLVFGAAVAINLRRHRDMLCHCYGSLAGERLSVRSLVQIGLLLAATLLVWSGGGVRVLALAGPDAVLAAAGWAVASLLVGLWLLHADEVVRLYRRGCRSCTRRAGVAGRAAS
ncbi:MAG TPA: MauE/DoxX family redox-associated membrane protein [Candidatus Dormibacteraeota bacterium]